MVTKTELFIRKLPDNYIVNKVVSLFKLFLHSIKDRRNILHGRERNPNELYLNKNPLISVYIPTYNRASILIERAMPSVLEQSYKNIELIIADDGSTDATESVVKSFNDPRIRYIKVSRSDYRYPNKSFYHWLSGPVVAANAALDECKGLWIARIDDDDLWTKDHLEKLVNFAVEGNFEFVSSDLLMKTKDEEKIVTGSDDPKDLTGIGATQTWLYRNYLGALKYNIHSWRKSYFKVNDTDLQYRIYKAGVRTGYLEEITAIIEPRPDEKYIGSKAYLDNPDKYEEFYNEL